MRETEGLSNRLAYRVDRLSFRYRHDRDGQFGKGSEWALTGLTFEVLSGEVLGVIGPNAPAKPPC